MGRFSFLVNEVPLSLEHKRQWDPLSSHLLVLVIEVDSILLRKGREGGFISSFKLAGGGGEGGDILHLLFVDERGFPKD